jgi:hypothetical protein
MMQDIYHKNYELVTTSIVPLDSETRIPFIKCFYYDNPASIDLPNSFCIEIPSGFTSPVFYMYYYNPYPDDITFKHEEMIGLEGDAISFTPTSDNAASIKYVDVDQLYEHGGTNQWMADNSFYSGGQPQDITGISQQVVDLCNGDSIVLKGYSYGYVYWGITPEPFRMANTTSASNLRLWPVPAAQDIYVQVDLLDEIATYRYSVTALSGQTVVENVFPDSGYLTIKRDHLPSGIYLFSIRQSTGEVIEQKLLVWE